MYIICTFYLACCRIAPYCFFYRCTIFNTIKHISAMETPVDPDFVKSYLSEHTQQETEFEEEEHILLNGTSDMQKEFKNKIFDCQVNCKAVRTFQNIKLFSYMFK